MFQKLGFAKIWWHNNNKIVNNLVKITNLYQKKIMFGTTCAQVGQYTD